MQLAHILRTKGSRVVTVHPHDSVLAAARTFVDERIGAAVVMADETVVGIVSERDILQLVARQEILMAATSINSIMTGRVVTAPPDATLKTAMDLMTENRIRHLPIVENQRLVGIVSIGDVVNELRKVSEEENSHLRSYIASSG